MRIAVCDDCMEESMNGIGLAKKLRMGQGGIRPLCSPVFDKTRKRGKRKGTKAWRPSVLTGRSSVIRRHAGRGASSDNDRGNCNG